MFIGRVNELAELERGYRREGFSIFELYAARNAGKTSLLEEFCRNKDSIYFTSAETNGRANLIAFSKLVFSHYKDTRPQPFTFWSEAFSYIVNKQEGIKVIIVLDNFDALSDRDPVFTDMLCKCITSDLKDSNIFMILSGRKKIFTGKNASLFQKLMSSLKLDKFTLTDDVVDKLRKQLAGSSQGTPDKAKMIRCSEEDVILREGETNSEMYKIISGRAVCYLGYGTDEEYLVGTFQEGQCFGEYSLLTGNPGVYTAVAYSDMLLMRIPRDEFTRFVAMNADNSVGIMRNMAKMINILKVNIDLLRGELAGEG
ncbi:MAG: cyclic nucleotide-binding domain-containing protein [Synergistaceae bacterium]|nr:cyclic nucleotide-binding domain-containing protein [Synergistaceae bacterium]